MKTKSKTLVKALRHMNEEIESSIIAEAADRIEELEAKVSELIVRECSIIIQDFVDHRIPASEYPNRLKDHFKEFGVEE